MNILRFSLAAAAAALPLTLLAAPAHADEAPASNAPALAPASQPDQSLAAKAERPFKHVSIELNPIAATIGRYSAQVEWLPMEHHAIVLNPHVDHSDFSVDDGTFKYNEGMTGFGGELGYRFYTGSSGATGFFIGPSFLLANYTASVGNQSSNFTNMGAAVDVGGQAIIGPGIVIGAGVGIQYTGNLGQTGSTDHFPLAANAFAGGGVLPRLLFSVGYSF